MDQAGPQAAFLLSAVVPQHAKILVDALDKGHFQPAHMRALVSVEQQWSRLAHLEPHLAPCLEGLSNVVVAHLAEGKPLPVDISPIGAACAQAHHSINNRAARVHDQSKVHFQSYAHLLVQLAQRHPQSADWHEYAAHTINAAAALGTHLDWVTAVQTETPRYRRGQRAPVRK